MSESDRVDLEMRVLVVAPTGRDEANSKAVLDKAGIACVICRDVREVCRELGAGAGAVLLTEESLSLDQASLLADTLRRQPPWSDLPVAVPTRGGPDSPAALRAMQTLGNVIPLERPVRISTLVTAVRTALRMRTRQYQSRKHLADLKDADHRKDEFLAMLAHELRNPLAPIRNALQVFRLLGPTDGNLQWAREVVERQVHHLTRLVDDLLDVSRISRGKVELKKERVELATVIARAVETSRPLLDARKQELNVALPNEPVFLEGDLTRLAQVISNLLNNAAKYTPERGHVWLRAERGAGGVTVSVRDDGVGIPSEMLHKVFDLFTQVDGSLDRSQGGLGIGLTLVRRIVEMHGGSVQAASSGLGRGSEFTVRLPALAETTRPGEPGRPGERTVATVPRRILVVDDNVDAAESLAMLLSVSQHQVRAVYSGVSALELAESFRPEVVILDIGLPGMNGYELARRLRGRPGLGKPILIALTGYGQEEDRQQARDAGFDHHLTKPADLEVLQRLLAQIE